jgi:glyoxylase-like metal-dependent hydrolase (beta-lactamase superfamily II)
LRSINPVAELSPHDLAVALESGENLQILDVRAPEHLGQNRIDLVPAGRFHNIRGSEVLRLSSLAGTGIDPDLPVAVCCGRGHDSQAVAAHLNALGIRARSVTGGLAAWDRLALPRTLPPPSSVDALVQFDRVAKGALGYLMVSGTEALIVDPPLECSAYLGEVAKRGARVVGVADTHVHADYVSGASRLAREHGVPYYLHPADGNYPYDGRPGRLSLTPVRDGDTIAVGRARVRVHHNHGHTLGSVSYLIGDEAALTGDFLFVASIGRPDLAGKTAEWTALLWESVERVRREWPPSIVIYPAHYGAEEERNPDRSVGAPLSRLVGTNAALRHATAGDFEAWVAGRVGAFPEAYRTMKAVNIGLVDVTDDQAQELEVGRNECALGRR